MLGLGLWLSACRSPVPEPDAGPRDGGLDAAPIDAAPFDGAVPQGPLRMATWNLEFFPRAPTTVETVAGLIASERLDVIAVQEITDPASFFALAGQLGTYDAMIARGGGNLEVGLLVHRGRVEVTAVDTLFESDRYAFPRPVLSVALRTRPASGLPAFDLRLLVLHLKANIDSESQARRAAAVTELDRFVRSEMSDPDREHDIVILGDYNDSVVDEEPDNVFAPFLDQPTLYATPTLPLERSGGRTFLPFFAFFDHVVMTRDALDEFGSGTVEVRHLEEGFGEYPLLVSDHLPVVATFDPR